MENINTPSLDANKLLDVCDTPCSIKHGLILRTWRELPVGDFFILRNGHDPVPLRYQIEAMYPGALRWEYVERADDAVSVKLTKLIDVQPAGETPSSCGQH